MQEDFNSSENYCHLPNDEALLYNSILESSLLGNQNILPDHMFEHSMGAYQEQHMPQQIDSNNFQGASSALNLPIEQTIGSTNTASRSSTNRASTVTHEVNTVASETDSVTYSETEIDLLGPYANEDTLTTRTIPEFDNWPGSYGFDMDIPEEQAYSSLVYSVSRNKIYVKKDEPFQVNFLASGGVPSDAKIRALGMFIEREYASEIVKRCDNHTLVDFKRGVRAPDHVMRCECEHVSYEKDCSGRRSLVVPYENPQRGQYCSSYVFRFVCSGGCLGGLNRRPFRIIFTLENGDTVIGRRSVEVKICEDPTKDSQRDERRAQRERKTQDTVNQTETSLVPPPGKKRKRSEENSHLIKVLDMVNRLRYSSNLKLVDEEEDNGGPYKIVVPDRETYEFLMLARLTYVLEKQLRMFSPYITQYLESIQKQKKKKK